MSEAPGEHGLSLADARLAEAQALLEMNQVRRGRAEAVLALISVMGLGAAIVAIVARRPEALLPVAPVALGLTSLSFQQYADVNVLARARAELERSINAAVGAPALLYESYIAEIRKTRPLVTGVRVLQLLAHLGTLAAVVAGAIVATENRWWVVLAYAGSTIVAAGSCLISHADMRRAWDVAGGAIGEL
jgi:hypothetical protein